MSQSPEAYERLILDAMRGDATLFTRNDEVDAQWSIIDPILQTWASGSPPLAEYEAGTPGPAEADELLGEGRHWRAHSVSGRSLVRARHDAGADRGRAARHRHRAPPLRPSVRPRAGAQRRGGRRRRVPRRDREPARARRPLPPVAARAVRGRAGARDDRRVGGRRDRRRRADGPGTSPSRASAWRSRSASATCPSSTRSSTRCSSPTWRRWCGRRTGTRRRSTRCGGSRRSCSSTAQDEPDVSRGAAARPTSWPSYAYVVDLAWLRSTPWRERVAAAFDPPALRAALAGVSGGDRPPPPRLGRRRAAVLRLAGVAPGLEGRSRWPVAATS